MLLSLKSTASRILDKFDKGRSFGPDLYFVRFNYGYIQIDTGGVGTCR